jgi:type IV pilus biogenesis protein PilP
MQAVSRLVLVSILAAGCARAEQAPETSSRPRVAVDGATQVAPPAPPQLAPLSPDFQAAMANSQLATYRYNQLTEQALALKKLCDTGFGPGDICPKAVTVAVGGSGSAAPADLPTVTEITGSRNGLSAVLALSDGRHVLVRPGSVLPDGRRVGTVSNDDVRIVRDGGDIVLSFAGADTK